MRFIFKLFILENRNGPPRRENPPSETFGTTQI